MDSVDPDLFIAEVTKVFGHFMKYAVDSFEPEEMVRYPLSLSQSKYFYVLPWWWARQIMLMQARKYMYNALGFY